jgi:hypothetical protein
VLVKIKVHFEVETRNVVFILLHYIANAGILEMKTVTKNNKSEKYITLIGVDTMLPTTLNLGVYPNPCRISVIDNNLFYVGSHYSSLRRIVHTNKASRNKLTITNLDFLKARTSLKLMLKWRLLQTFRARVLQVFGLDPRLNELEFAKHLASLKLNL